MAARFECTPQASEASDLLCGVARSSCVHVLILSGEPQEIRLISNLCHNAPAHFPNC